MAGDVLLLAVSGIDCGPAALPGLQVRISGVAVPALSVQPADGATGVCQVGFEVPSGITQAYAPVSVTIARPYGTADVSNTVLIGTEN
jgi:hypothetical protein